MFNNFCHMAELILIWYSPTPTLLLINDDLVHATPNVRQELLQFVNIM